jgi:hypothetical protein
LFFGFALKGQLTSAPGSVRKRVVVVVVVVSP